MGRRSHKKRDEKGSGSDTGTQSSDTGKGECIPAVKRIIGMYTPNRKGTSAVLKTPGSVSRRMGPPRNYPGTPKSARSANGNGLHIAKPEQDPIQVYCRVKPSNEDGNGCIQIQSENQLSLTPPDNPVYWRQNQAKEGHYSFSKVFDGSVVQKAVFNEVALPLVTEFVQGKNALLFAYGVTGSGKTYTMSGSPTECGIMPRCLDVIFNSIQEVKATKYVFKPDRMNGFESQSKADAMVERHKEIMERTRSAGLTPRTRARNPANDMDNFATRDKDLTKVPVTTKDQFYSVFITYVEIYNNFVYDLLDETPIEVGKKQGLQSKMLREDVNHNVYVNGVAEVEVESPSEAFEVFQRGQRRRRIAHTALNTESSRSHSIFNIRLVRAPADKDGEEVSDNKEQITVSQLSLVDLAGSERYSRTGATGDRLKEAGNINVSLMTLRKCMDILRQNQMYQTNTVVPFRDSKLTHYLKNYFEGEGRVKMILCINPRADDYDENFHVLSFAEQAQEVQITRPQEKKVVDVQTPGRVKANELYKETVRRLVTENVVSEGELPKIDTEFVFLNLPIPICHLTKSNEAEILATLKKALEMRIKGQTQLRTHIHKEQEEFRNLLITMEREYETSKHEINSYKVKVDMLLDEKSKNEGVLRQLMKERTELSASCESKDQLINQLEDELADLRLQFRERDMQHNKEKQTMRTDLDLQRELDELKRQRQIQRDKKTMKDEFKVKEKTLAAVRQLVSAVDLNVRESRRSRSRRRSNHRALDDDSMSTTTSSEPDLTSVTRVTRAKSSGIPIQGTSRPRAPSAPLLPIDNMTVSTSTPLSSTQVRRGAGIPTHRARARSTDKDIWVEHTSGIAVKDSTVFQPSMKKKKSVTKLGLATDIPSNASKYCLRTQEQDSEGEIETKLYKGDVINTVGGGSQVIFNDVEVLRQESPTRVSPTRKRRSSGLLGLGLVSSSPFRTLEANPEGLGDRCRQGMGSSMLANKRSRTNF